LIEVDLNPWQIKWGYDKLQVGFGGALTDDLDWYLSSDNVNQSFNCYVTLKKRKTAKQITATARAIWLYEPYEKGIRNWLKKRFGRIDSRLKSDERKIEFR
jgi:hypothetical protein